MQHPKGPLAPAPTCQNPTSDGAESDTMGTGCESLLGAIVPHSIRGSLYSLTQFLPTTQSFDHCTACSSKILQAFAEKGFDFVKEVCNSSGGSDSNYLENLAGLSNLMSDINMDDVMVDFELDSNDSSSDRDVAVELD